jgi:hypothetical protein
MACSINRLPRSVPAAMALAPRTKKLLRFIVIANSFPYLFNVSLWQRGIDKKPDAPPRRRKDTAFNDQFWRITGCQTCSPKAYGSEEISLRQ